MGMPHLSPALCWAALPLLALNDPVRLESGSISGAAGGSAEVRVYKGIPYAKPPVGELRWKPPKPPASWRGVRRATQFSAVCEQVPYPKGSVYDRAFALAGILPAGGAPQSMSEDCLYLNVWTAAKTATERRPVMVWIHGGGFEYGSGDPPMYGGEELAKKGVVFVSINYRLGLFGFFAHPELTSESDHHSSGNYALLDQIAALEWVRKNIAAFGGDPKRVTIFGESAGSWSVNFLMATPLAKGLFQRAIGESSAYFQSIRTLTEVERAGIKFAESNGGSVAALRARPADDLLRVPSSFRQNVDGWVLPADVYTVFSAGKQNDVPLIAGWNADEGRSLSPWPDNSTLATFVDGARKVFGPQTGDFLKLYPAASDREAAESHYASFRDQNFGWQIRTWVRLASRVGRSKAYLYYFSRIPPGPDSSRYRAFHGAEIAYVFHNLDVSQRPWEDTDRKLSDHISSYWVNFAATGDPNAPGLPQWPAYEERSDLALELGDKIAPIPSPNKAGLDFFESYFRKRRSGN